MKILLIGEFSGFHNSLREGLLELGHEVKLVSSGDGWKNLDSDLIVRSNSTNKYMAILERNLKPFMHLSSLAGFDIVQFVNVKPLSCSLKANYYFSKILKSINGTMTLSACGNDSTYWLHGKKGMRYSPHEDILKYDSKSNYWSLENSIQATNRMIDLVDGIIPVMYEYSHAYQSKEKTLPIIPLPVNLNKIDFSPSLDKKPINFYHGLNRVGAKGTPYIKLAFQELNKKYKGKARFDIKDNMPYREYLNYISNVFAVVDQTSSYSSGMNGLISLAMGKVVFGGAEREYLQSLGVTESPIINIRPDSNHIYRVMSEFLDGFDLSIDYAYKSREFVSNNHNHILIAQKYVEQWKDLS